MQPSRCSHSSALRGRASKKTDDQHAQSTRQGRACSRGAKGTRLSSWCAQSSSESKLHSRSKCYDLWRFPRHVQFGRLLFLGVIVGASLSSSAAQNSTKKWCNNENEPDEVSTVEICFEPSVGPMAGGVMVTVRGMKRAADRQSEVDWTRECSSYSLWQCTFAHVRGDRMAPVPAKASSCEDNYIVCESPAQVNSGDVFVSVSNVKYDYHIPSPRGRNEIFSYYGNGLACNCKMYATPANASSGGLCFVCGSQRLATLDEFNVPGIAKINPISGVAGMRPKIAITLLNRKEEVQKWKCRLIAYGPGWKQRNAIPPEGPAFLQKSTGRLLCPINDSVLLLEDGSPWAQVSSNFCEVCLRDEP